MSGDDFREAANHFSKALELNPSAIIHRIVVQINLGWALIYADAEDEAITYFRNAIACAPVKF